MGRFKKKYASTSSKRSGGAVPEGVAPSSDDPFSAIISEIETKFGVGVYTSSDADKLIVGVPVPAIAIRYLIANSVWPLQRIYQFSGLYASGKSSLLYEVMGWHIDHGGFAFLAEAETKDSPGLRLAILGKSAERVAVTNCPTIEDWQALLTFTISKIKDHYPDPKKCPPVCFGIDSIAGRTTESVREKIVEEDGHATRGHPQDALMISRYMRALPTLLGDYPFTIIGTNHLKKMQVGLATEEYTIGGSSIKFHETIEIKVEPGRKITNDRKEVVGFERSLTIVKNSLGPPYRTIKVPFRWEYVMDGDELKQKAYWDWDFASVSLLLSFADELEKEAGIDLRRRGNRFYVCSSALGIPENDSMSYWEFSRWLEENKDVLKKIHSVLKITERQVWGYDRPS